MFRKENSARVKLLTVLNVVATRPPLKRKRDTSVDEDNESIELGLRDWRMIARSAVKDVMASQVEPVVDAVEVVVERIDQVNVGDQEELGSDDTFDTHFGAETPLLTPETIAAATSAQWSTTSTTLPTSTQINHHLDCNLPNPPSTSRPLPALTSAWNQVVSSNLQPLVKSLNSYSDVWISDIEYGKPHAKIRHLLSVWLLQHILKTRQKVLKNNEYVTKETVNSKEPKPPATRDVRDQGFTRPKILLLLPFRSSCLSWLNTLIKTSPENTTPQKLDRFRSEYTLPEGVTDKLLEPDATKRFPKDHVETFKGNIDDDFKIGVKWTRTEIRLYTEMYGSDLVIGSPVGLRSMIEKEGNSDFLSSIEMVIVDQMDVMQMQNWDHVNFIFDRLNQLPTETRDTDFSRIRPWYLEQQSHLLRQTILLSAFSTPESRSLYRTLCNVSGKTRFENPSLEGEVLGNVTRGITQVWNRFECESIESEEDTRWNWFTQHTLPSILRSAVSSSQGTMIFVASYFDFVKMDDYFQKLPDMEYATISEYSTNADISRARSSFYNGQVKFLIVTERFHFYRRYKLRGAKTIIFYAPPTHALFYNEILSYPLLDSQDSTLETTTEVFASAEDVNVQVIFCKWDEEKVGRIVGSEHVERLVKGDGTRFTFQ